MNELAGARSPGRTIAGTAKKLRAQSRISPYDLPRERRFSRVEFLEAEVFGKAPVKRAFALRGLTLADLSGAAFASCMRLTSPGGAPIVGVIFIATSAVNRGVGLSFLEGTFSSRPSLLREPFHSTRDAWEAEQRQPAALAIR
ncbi:MAG: hypothetical protein JOY76_10620 [Hyphomicrobiales bacterium]|nr:hypothetical protein [Hyphomicrobiales bacterium]